MVDKIAKYALLIGFVLTIIHWVYKHFLINRPAPELLIAIVILAIPVILIFSGKIKLKD